MLTSQAQSILETALICASQPMSVRDMRVLFADEVSPETIKTLLQNIQLEYAQKGIELVEVAHGWRFQSRPTMRHYLDRLHPEKPPKYSRAVLETLAIIAHRQPVTRGEMEDIRGVTINSLVIKQLEDRGWVETIGHRETVGRPALFATTKQFLDDLGLSSIEELRVESLEGFNPSAFEQLDPRLEAAELGGVGDVFTQELPFGEAATQDAALLSALDPSTADPLPVRDDVQPSQASSEDESSSNEAQP